MAVIASIRTARSFLLGVPIAHDGTAALHMAARGSMAFVVVASAAVSRRYVILAVEPIDGPSRSVCQATRNPKRRQGLGFFLQAVNGEAPRPGKTGYPHGLPPHGLA
jgi:hypothetical protein